jgi:cell wall-associated NlpC family hydrolase
MKRALLVLMVAVAVTVGAIPAVTTLAATSRRQSHLNHQHSPSHTGWIMTRPDVVVTTQTVVPQNNVSGADVARFALRYLGYAYTLTGNAPSLGFSCIGFVSYVYQSFGIPLPDDLWNGRAYAPSVPVNELRPGDILWFGNTVWAGLSHTAIYIGGDRFVHAAWYNVGVIVSSFQSDRIYGNYWAAHYLGATRPWGGPGSRTPVFAATIDRYLFPDPLQALPNIPAVLVTAPVQRLRAWWSLSAPVRRTVPRAMPLVPLQRRGDWYQVMTPDGVTGWVPTDSRLPALADGPGDPLHRVVPARPSPLAARYQQPHRQQSLRSSGAVARHLTTSTRRRAAGQRRPAGRQSPRTSRHPQRRQAAPRTHRTAPARRRFAGQDLVPRVSGSCGIAQVATNVRSRPSLHGRIITVIPPGDAYCLLEIRQGWGQVTTSNGRQGWMAVRPVQTRATRRTPSGRQLEPSRPVQRAQARFIHRPARVQRWAHLTVTARLHAGPSLKTSVLRLVQSGTAVRVLGRQGRWTAVQLRRGQWGYVLSHFVRH